MIKFPKNLKSRNVKKSEIQKIILGKNLQGGSAKIAQNLHFFQDSRTFLSSKRFLSSKIFRSLSKQYQIKDVFFEKLFGEENPPHHGAGLIFLACIASPLRRNSPEGFSGGIRIFQTAVDETVFFRTKNSRTVDKRATQKKNKCFRNADINRKSFFFRKKETTEGWDNFK